MISLESVAAELASRGVNEKAFGAFVALAGSIADVARGTPTLADGAAIANAILSGIAAIDPAIAPILGLAEAAEPVFQAIVEIVKANPGGVFDAAPRGGPPIAAADWSHGIPQPHPVDNPSGAIGGA